MDSSKLSVVNPLVFFFVLLALAFPQVSRCTPYIPAPSVSEDAQKQFLSGMNTVFSGREENRLGWGRSAMQIALPR